MGCRGGLARDPSMPLILRPGYARCAAQDA